MLEASILNFSERQPKDGAIRRADWSSLVLDRFRLVEDDVAQ